MHWSKWSAANRARNVTKASLEQILEFWDTPVRRGKKSMLIKDYHRSGNINVKKQCFHKSQWKWKSMDHNVTMWKKINVKKSSVYVIVKSRKFRRSFYFLFQFINLRCVDFTFSHKFRCLENLINFVRVKNFIKFGVLSPFFKYIYIYNIFI